MPSVVGAEGALERGWQVQSQVHGRWSQSRRGSGGLWLKVEHAGSWTFFGYLVALGSQVGHTCNCILLAVICSRAGC